MRSEERAPTQDELLAMAYVDGELDAPSRRDFEGKLAGRDDLRLEVTRLRRLELLARQAAGPEPMDYEWSKLARDPLHRAGLGSGFALLAGGAAVLVVTALVLLWTSDAASGLKYGASALALGLALIFGVTLRARLRTKPYDPYTDIQR